MGIKIGIHQPEYLPWLGYFDKLRQVDCFVLLDHVPVSNDHYFQNRNRVRGEHGPVWLTVPIHSKGQPPLCEVKIVEEEGNWGKRHWRTIQHLYGKSAYFDWLGPKLQLLFECRWHLLTQLNESFLRILTKAFGIEVPFILSSSMDLSGKKSDLILEICQKLQADCYFSGVSGRDYLNLASFEAAGIEVVFQEFKHPQYKQRYEPFLPCMSAIDLLFHYGPASLELLKGQDIATLNLN